MIITRTPHRLSFFGGGSDIVDYYTKNNGGCVLSSAINKYIYVIINARFDDEIRIGYSKTETVKSVDEIEHNIVKECLKYFGIKKGIEIVSVSDIPKERGLSSSSAFTVGLIHALSRFTKKVMNRDEIAKLASDIELKLGKTRGRQDAFGCAYGGIKYIQFLSNDEVKIYPLWLKTDIFFELEKRLRLFVVGKSRNAIDILNEIELDKEETNKRMSKVKEIARSATTVLKLNQNTFLEEFGDYLNYNWEIKKGFAKGVTNKKVDEMYNNLRRKGMIGGKLSGAGSSGYVLAYFKEPIKIDEYKELNFKFDTKGTVVIFDSERSIL